MDTKEKVNILLVDDRPENLLALDSVLESLGENCVLASSGDEALRRLLQQEFAVILLDVQMPDMDGVETAELIRQRDKTADTPIIFVTAINRSDAQVFRGYASGAIDYIFKPFDPEVLRSKVRVFVNLYRKNLEIQRQAQQLHELQMEREMFRRRIAEDRLNAAISGSPTMIFAQDRDLRFTWAFNIPFTSPEDIFGKIEGRDIRPLCPQIVELKRAAFESGVRQRGSMPITLGAREHFYDVSVTPTRGAFGEINGLITSATDLTELRDVQEALRESEARMKAVVESAVDGIITLDETGGIETVNPAARNIFGYEPEELLGRNIKMLMPPPYRGEHDEYLNRYLRTGVPRIIGSGRTVTGLRKNGEEFPMDLAVSEVKFSTRRIFVGVVRDVTIRAQYEERLQILNETLERRVAERTSEARNRALQMRALTVQLAETEQRERRRLAQLLHDHVQQLLVAIQFTVENISRQSEMEKVGELCAQTKKLIRQTIDDTRSLSVQLSPPVLYESGLAPALEWLARQFRDKHGLEVTVEERGLGAGATQSDGSKIFLFEAIRELLFNVVKHAKSKRAWVRLNQCDEWLRIEVVDEGAGLPVNGARPNSGQSGFGLFHIRERVELMNGEFELERRPEGGSRARLTLPLSAVAPPQPAVQCASNELPANP